MINATCFPTYKDGFYTITIKDADDCPKEISVVIPRGNSGVSYAAQIKPIADAFCAISGRHNGANAFSLFQKNAQKLSFEREIEACHSWGYCIK